MQRPSDSNHKTSSIAWSFVAKQRENNPAYPRQSQVGSCSDKANTCAASGNESMMAIDRYSNLVGHQSDITLKTVNLE